MYRFYAQAFHGEREKEAVSESRDPQNYNMIMFIIEDVDYTETIVLDAVNSYVSTYVIEFRVSLIGWSGLTILMVTLFSLSLINV
jgi:hypothetical protein